MTITKKNYETYLDTRKFVIGIEDAMTILAKEIVLALYREEAKRFYFGEKQILYTCERDLTSVEPDGQFPVELLYDPNWKETVARIVYEKKQRMNEWSEECKRREQQSLEQKEQAELKRLKEKYGGWNGSNCGGKHDFKCKEPEPQVSRKGPVGGGIL